jgi:hypothetical protein
VKKTVNLLCGSSKFIKPRNINVNVDHNDMAVDRIIPVTVKGFKNCCTSNAVDGTNDDTL